MNSYRISDPHLVIERLEKKVSVLEEENKKLLTKSPKVPMQDWKKYFLAFVLYATTAGLGEYLGNHILSVTTGVIAFFTLIMTIVAGNEPSNYSCKACFPRGATGGEICASTRRLFHIHVIRHWE